MAGNSTVEEVPPPQYQVFINFRGEELRNGFVSHLVHALKRRQINAFYDGYENKGEPLEKLLKRIEESRIALAILPINYNESVWCLRELAKMKECKEKLVTIPIFYKVKTSTVEDMSGQLDKAIAGLDRGDATKKKKEEKKKEWEEALKWITSLIGFRVEHNSNENEIIQQIVEEVYKWLNKIQSETPNIQVFISFQGRQLRSTFVGYLMDALQKSKINVFPDNHEHRGEAIGNVIGKWIEDSEIAIVVFSSKYTESRWCLDELVEINEHAQQGLLKVC